MSGSEWLLKRYFDSLSLTIMDRPRVSFLLLLMTPLALPVFWWRIAKEFIITTPVVCAPVFTPQCLKKTRRWKRLSAFSLFVPH
jgi:hypothetical protein